MNKVIIDTDFLNHILNATNGETIMKVIKEFFDFEFIMHPWVYEREIKGISTKGDEFVKNNVCVLKYEDFIKDEDDDITYEFTYKAIYREMNGKSVNFKGQTYRTYNASGENLGEIHSVIMSQYTGVPLLLSDDFNAKEIAAKRINREGYSLDVRKSIEVLCEIITKDKDKLNKDDVISVIRNHKEKYHKDYIRQVKELYRQN